MQSLPAPKRPQPAEAQNTKDNIEAVMANEAITIPSLKGGTFGESLDDTSDQVITKPRSSVGTQLRLSNINQDCEWMKSRDTAEN
jgi:hypothetical protein